MNTKARMSLFRHRPKTIDGWKPEFDQLARFNAEKARGILHAEEYRRKMDAVQRDFDEQYRDDGS